MAHQPVATQIRLNNILKCLTIAVDTLEVLGNSFKIPFLEAISNTAKSLLTAVQSIRQNKSDCTHLVEQTYRLLCAIISLYMKPEIGPDLPPSMLNDLGKFTETLYKIHTFIEAQQDKSKFRHFFRQGEMSKLLRDCNMGLQDALNLLKKFARERHQEVLELIDTLSEGGDGTTSDQGSLTNWAFSSSYNRIAILGAGGMGKTSLARAVLHHPTITAKYAQHRYFVACDSTSTSNELVVLIGAHLGLKPNNNLAKVVLHHFNTNPPSLLILDNLETLWEPAQIRRDIEEFLSLLTDVKHLALIITMRGTERPASVRWTRPFLPAMKPLAQDAARQTFIDIADEGHDGDDIDKVLLLTGNMPLAIDLMAHLVESEGCNNVLARWEEEKTSVLSNGYDKRSNLDVSISVSLSSPRITSVPHCQDLLSLLSILPDGLSDVELLQSKLPIKDILTCKVALLSTSLAYIDDHRRFKALVPIWECIKKSCPPLACLTQPLLKYFQECLEFRDKYYGTLSVDWRALVDKAMKQLPHCDDSDVQWIYYQQYNNDIPTAANYCHTGLSLATSTGNTRRQCQSSILLAWITWLQGDPVAGQIYSSEAQRLAKLSADLYNEAQALDIRAICWQTLGDYKYTASLCIRARDLLARCGMSGGDRDLSLMGTQAETHNLKSEYVEARNIQSQILRGGSSERASSSYAFAFALLNIAELDVLLGTPPAEVHKNIDTAKSIFNSVQHLVCAMICDAIMGALHLREKDLLSAKMLFHKCLSFFWGNRPELVNYCLERLGDRSLWDSPNWSASWTIVYLVHASKSKQKLDVYKALQFLGDVFLVKGDHDTAVSLLTFALEGFTQMDVHRSRAACMLRLGDISKQDGDTVKAMDFWKTARPLFQRSSQTKLIALIDKRLTDITPEDNEQSLSNLSHLHAPAVGPEEFGSSTTLTEGLGSTDENKDAVLVLI
ncbi:hypothetical protein DFH09DRAFT_1273372 [Mycena vulgaris]|nr:hypothetical protein DFH09DRAFT_1273372 [Mycena vulgaris]